MSLRREWHVGTFVLFIYIIYIFILLFEVVGCLLLLLLSDLGFYFSNASETQSHTVQ